MGKKKDRKRVEKAAKKAAKSKSKLFPSTIAVRIDASDEPPILVAERTLLDHVDIQGKQRVALYEYMGEYDVVAEAKATKIK